MRKQIVVVAVGVMLIVALCIGVALAPYRLGKARKTLPLCKQAALKYQLDAALLLAIANTESGFDNEAVSKAGAVGLMQIMPNTAKWVCEMRAEDYSEKYLTDAQINMDIAAWYLAYLLRKYSLFYTLCAYNAGEGVAASWQQDDIDQETIPYPETKRYVQKVLQTQNVYRQLFGIEEPIAQNES